MALRWKQSVLTVLKQYFKTHTNTELIERLQLKEMPTVITVTNDSSLRFELAEVRYQLQTLRIIACLWRNTWETVVGQGNGTKEKMIKK